jgi:homoserine O-acetyltransferase
MMNIFKYNQAFLLNDKTSVTGLELGYTIIGSLSPESKIVWVFHALTANSDPSVWWPGLIGENTFFDPEAYTIICVNIPGSCYGSTGPLSENPETGKPYWHSFPVFSVPDIIRAFQLVKEHLQIKKIHIGIGASMGGQHLLQWAVLEPGLFENIIVIACNAVQSAYGLAIDTAQRLAIEADGTWKETHAAAGENGMKAARAMALIQYRSYQSFAARNYADTQNAETYQRYQAKKIAERFNAFSYYNLSLSRNTHDTERDLEKITAQTLVLGFDTDALFPVTEQELLAKKIKNARLEIIHSTFGHDAFLIETGKITACIKNFLEK